jgi:hypothetical protein
MQKILSTLLVFSTLAHAGEIPKNEDYTLLLSSRPVTTLDQIQAQALNFKPTKKSLWSGSYWPFYQGSLGARYRDPSFRAVMEKTYKFEEYVSLRGARVNPNDLSPAEKYDLLLGDSLGTFTETQWKNGDDNRSFSGAVPTWRGICDGWAAASMTWNRPAKSVTLLSVNGQPVTFFPEDIKALGSQLHAKGFKTVTFLGRRCNGTTGWITGACGGVNPAALHLALVNSVGIEGSSFVLDISPGKEVWNYPVQEYSLSFTNPLTGAEAPDWKSARVELLGNERDLREHKRADGTRWIVAVKAKVKFMDMRDGGVNSFDSSEFDKILEKEWSYELEVDGRGQVIGGEWLSKARPDFMWAPKSSSLPVSSVERRSSLSFDHTRPLSPALAGLGIEASKSAQPLAVIVNKLFELSK